jgi:membrane protease YdiL (CAAX protease family)
MMVPATAQTGKSSKWDDAVERISPLDRRFFVVYIVYLFVVQTVYSWIYSESQFLREQSALQISIRLITWTIPVLAFLAITKRDILLFLALRRNALRGFCWGIVAGLAIISGQAAFLYATKGTVRINLDLGWGLWWKAIILVGFSEEVVFRGFVMRHLCARTHFGVANLIQSCLFLLIHCPGWLLLGQFVYPGIVHSAGYILALSIFLGFVANKSRSLWACMLIHSASNFSSFAIT